MATTLADFKSIRRRAKEKRDQAIAHAAQ